MALIKTFTFTGSLESWVGTDENRAYAVNTSTDIGFDALGRNQDGLPTWEWTGTWEDLGASVGDTITDCQISFDGEVDGYETVDTAQVKLQITVASTTYDLYT
ncbi:MAG: hypothetical protein KQ78_01887 [Candidatus Izimaplasma bacterium HR2]|nr:MAG: hypothetical protein KQ78_01887 [Candidatus Izimaplasma bacterium HR2]